MKEFKLIVAGGRDFVDEDLLVRTIIAMADVEFADFDVSIVSGMAKGADALAYKFAHTHEVQVYEFYADWKRNGKSAGFVRNAAMGMFADGLLAFWDGQSHGTEHMINFMKRQGKPVHVVTYYAKAGT